MKCAVFLERDGLLNRVRVDGHRVFTPLTVDEFELLPEAGEPLHRLRRAGFLLIVTTCQPGVSRGYQSRRDLDAMHRQLREYFPLDDLFVCPHDEADRCPCRKPKPGLLVEAAFKWHIDLEHSYVVSPRWQDVEAARNAGCLSVLVDSPWKGLVPADFHATDLPSAALRVLQSARAITPTPA
jgi:D-glycero-D-manno-heptose 1,7-bisphosphate phosphatase